MKERKTFERKKSQVINASRKHIRKRNMDKAWESQIQDSSHIQTPLLSNNHIHPYSEIARKEFGGTFHSATGNCALAAYQHRLTGPSLANLHGGGRAPQIPQNHPFS